MLTAMKKTVDEEINVWSIKNEADETDEVCEVNEVDLISEVNL